MVTNKIQPKYSTWKRCQRNGALSHFQHGFSKTNKIKLVDYPTLLLNFSWLSAWQSGGTQEKENSLWAGANRWKFHSLTWGHHLDKGRTWYGAFG
jgi:hypothetical protein